MLKNYLKTALRNLLKQKGFSVINLLGLALGMGCSLLILLWVQDEKSVDAFHKNGDWLYTVYARFVEPGNADARFGQSGLLADEVKKKIPEVERATSFAWQETHTFMVGDKSQKEDGNTGEADFFRMFSYPLLEGNADEALKTAESIAISRSMAGRFFGSPAAAIGQTIRYENRKDLVVKAVFEDLPANTSEHFDFLLSWELFRQEKAWVNEWGNIGPHTLLQLRSGADVRSVEKKLTTLARVYYPAPKRGSHMDMGLQRFDEGYLYSQFEHGIPAGGRIQYVHLFSLIAFFILAIACINFMNLTTARSTNRAREIGIRKVMGALRSGLIRQFIGEAVLMAALSALLALVLVGLMLPAFNELTRKAIVMPIGNRVFWLSLAGLVLLTGIVSGSYPALVLSSFQPVKVLKGMLSVAGGAIWLRKGLVVFQFTLSILLIISTVLIARQVNYVQNAHLGYDRENLLYIPIEGNLLRKTDQLIAEAGTGPGIAAVCAMSQEPTEIDNGDAGIGWVGKDPYDISMFTQIAVGYGYAKTMQIPVDQGRDFSTVYPTDSSGYLLNETALKQTGYKDPIGKPFTFHGRTGKIIGILRDFHFQSLHTAIRPMLVWQGTGRDNFSTLLVRTQPGKTREALASLAEICHRLNPRFPFSYKFSDEQYGRLYRSEQVVGRLSLLFALLAVFISCLGLLGLSTLISVQRKKEIGIRKVLGAGVPSLLGLLSRDFLLLVAIAFLIAAPLGGWGMHIWMEQFAYKTDMPWWVFVSAGMAAVMVAMGTVCWQAMRVARANPVDSLRPE